MLRISSSGDSGASIKAPSALLFVDFSLRGSTGLRQKLWFVYTGKWIYRPNVTTSHYCVCVCVWVLTGCFHRILQAFYCYIIGCLHTELETAMWALMGAEITTKWTENLVATFSHIHKYYKNAVHGVIRAWKKREDFNTTSSSQEAAWMIFLLHV